MNDETTAAQPAMCFANWLAFVQGADAKEKWEYPLFSDAHLTGELGTDLGPYQVFNTIAGASHRDGVPSAVLRAAWHLPQDAPKMEQTNTTRYHGGTEIDEITALLALELGIRAMSGPPTRWFHSGGDPLGRPVAFEHLISGNPSLTVSGSPSIPSLCRTVSLNDVQLLRDLPGIDPVASNPLVKAARLYQQAIWLADGDANLCWLLLVSAVETAANHWRRGTETPLERIRASRPSLESMLITAGGEQLLLAVASEIAPYMGSTKKFVDFLWAHRPEPPGPRPPEWASLDWTERGLRDALTRVYQHRSKALHGGTPFPGPMSRILRVTNEGWLPETPLGLAASEHGGVWIAEDMPMLLWVFHHVVRGALLVWWRTLIPDAAA